MRATGGQRYLARRGDVLYFRRGVPADVRAAFNGRHEVWVSLRTSSIPVARNRLQREVDQFEAKLASLRGEVSPAEIASARYTPTAKEIEVRVREAFHARLERVPPIVRNDVRAVEAARLRLEDLKAFQRSVVASRGLAGDNPPLDVQWQCEALCERYGWSLTDTSGIWWVLADMVARSQIEAAERQIQSLEGRPESAVDLAFGPDQYLRDARAHEQGAGFFGPPVSLLALFEEYVKERKPSPATVKSFGAKVRSLQSFLGHDDARRITMRDVALWKDNLLESGKADGSPMGAKTVRETYLPAIKSTLKHGVASGQLRENVAAGVTVAGRRRPARLRSPGFTDEEARRILAATLEKQSTRLSPESERAIRWIPWLLAYTGARVNEIAQLRVEDVKQVDNIWTLTITPEAGSTKDGNARVVALHPHLVKQGFPKVVKGCEGRIFFDPSRARQGSDQNPQSKKVGEHLAKWVRDHVGITDPRIKPNHGWRHRFKTIARDLRMIPEVRDYIQGHVPRNESEGYGDTSPKATLAEISRIPHYETAKVRRPR